MMPRHLTHEQLVVDPMKYVNQLKDDYKNRERAETQELIQKIEALGFTVNKKSKRKAA